MRIVCSGYLVRYPVGGFVWHHLQYLVGLRRMGHEVVYFESAEGPNACYDPSRDACTSEPGYSIGLLRDLLEPHGMARSWCWLGHDGTALGMERSALARACAASDAYLNLSNINWIPELEQCRRRVLVDTDPVFTQLGAHGCGGPLSAYDSKFTYGENVHLPLSSMPTAGQRWMPTRQPVVIDLWDPQPGPAAGPYSTLMSWRAFGDVRREGRMYGQKDRQFEPYFDLPRTSGQQMMVAVAALPADVAHRLKRGGWTVVEPLDAAGRPAAFQEFVRRSKAEFSVAKHAYVSTRCGWFSDRTTAYLASGRPAVVEDTGFTDWMETGSGVLAFGAPGEAMNAIAEVNARYREHCRAALEIAREYFDFRKVLGSLLERTFAARPACGAEV